MLYNIFLKGTFLLLFVWLIILFVVPCVDGSCRRCSTVLLKLDHKIDQVIGF